MEQIILNTNLRFVTAGLAAEQKGALLQALLEGNGETLVGEAFNIYQYIMTLQQEKADRKQRMRELSAKGVAARKRAADAGMADLFEEETTAGVPLVQDGEPAVENGDDERKEAKESNYNKIKKIFISSFEEEKEKKVAARKGRKKRECSVKSGGMQVKRAEEPFVPPFADEVRAFVEEEGLCVDPETFVDFYDSRGWKVGTTAIKNWKATVRLWHRRAVGKEGKLSPSPVFLPQGGGMKTVAASQGGGMPQREEEETYWHELTEKTRAVRTCPDSDDKEEAVTRAVGGDSCPEPDDGLELSPFARFMRRIENNDV